MKLTKKYLKEHTIVTRFTSSILGNKVSSFNYELEVKSTEFNGLYPDYVISEDIVGFKFTTKIISKSTKFIFVYQFVSESVLKPDSIDFVYSKYLIDHTTVIMSTKTDFINWVYNYLQAKKLALVENSKLK
jgi:hypothetical protein